jgi:lysophospholipase L1-like esterase
MKRKFAACIVLLALCAPGPASTLTEADEPGPGGIVFVGSSIFHRWVRLSEQMASLPIINLSFDGAQTSDMLRLIDSRLVPMRPKVVVYYAGSNDISAGDPAEAILHRIMEFVDRISRALPNTHFVFVSINRAPEKMDRWGAVNWINIQTALQLGMRTNMNYVDVNEVFTHRDGTPRFEMFLSDGLHLKPQAYEEFAKVLKPVLAKALAAPSLR